MKILPCAKRWNFASVDLSTRMVRTCCRAYGPVAAEEEVHSLGKSIFLNHPYMKKGRELMLKGEYQFDCRGCYDQLDEGQNSFMTPYPETLNQLSKDYGESPSELDQHFKESPFDPRYLTSHSAVELEVSFGNPCDLMCVYCSSTYSSLIESEEKKWNEPVSPFTQNPIDKNSGFLEAFWDWMDDSLKTLGNIHLIGGETLFNPYIWTFLEKTDRIYRKQNLQHTIFINVFSNLNNTASVEKFINTITSLHQNFKIKLLFSNESVGPKAEFIRHGMEWDKTLSNIQKVLESKRIDLGFAPSFNSLSITTAKSYLEFIHQLHPSSGKKFYCGDNYIPFPYGYSPFILTPDFVPHAEEALEFVIKRGPEFLLEESVARLTAFFTNLRHLLQSNQNNRSDELRRNRIDFARRIRTLKKRRKVDFEGTFPEYVNFYQLCEELDR